jgi:hypothetical protein
MSRGARPCRIADLRLSKIWRRDAKGVEHRAKALQSRTTEKRDEKGEICNRKNGQLNKHDRKEVASDLRPGWE